MSEGLNRVLLLGNLGADPELRMTQGGQAILKLRLATSETYLDRNKVKQEKTEWHSVTVWGKRGEALAKILSKGSRIFVEGSLRTSSYDDKDGNKRYKTEVNATNVILSGGVARNEPPEPRQGPASSGGGFSDEDYGNKPIDDDPIPFLTNVTTEPSERWWKKNQC